MKVVVWGKPGAILGLSLFFLGGTATLVHARPITLDNDVDISWSQVGPEACPILGLCPDPVAVIGLPRLVPNASATGSLLLFDVDIVSNAFASFRLFLNVGDASLEEVLVNGDPLRLTFETMPPMTDFFTAFPGGVIRLQDFVGFNLLPQGVDLVFTLEGTFEGKSVFCAQCPYGATIAVTGPGTELQAVPEPGTMILLLSGLAGAGINVRRRKRQSNALRQSPD